MFSIHRSLKYFVISSNEVVTRLEGRCMVVYHEPLLTMGIFSWQSSRKWIMRKWKCDPSKSSFHSKDIQRFTGLKQFWLKFNLWFAMIIRHVQKLTNDQLSLGKLKQKSFEIVTIVIIETLCQHSIHEMKTFQITNVSHVILDVMLPEEQQDAKCKPIYVNRPDVSCEMYTQLNWKVLHSL